MRQAPVIFVLYDSLAIVHPETDANKEIIERFALREPIRTLDAHSVDQIILTLKQEDDTIATLSGAGLVLPAHLAYTHVITIAGRRPSNQAIAFALEEFLPCCAEELVCSARPIDGQQSLGTGIPRVPLEQLLEGFASLGIGIEMITLDAFVASRCEPNGDAAGLLIRDGRRAMVAIRHADSHTPARIRTAINEKEAMDSHWLHHQITLLQCDSPPDPPVWHCFDMGLEEGIRELTPLLRKHEAEIALDTDGLVGNKTANRLWNRLALTGMLVAAACIVVLVQANQSLSLLGDELRTVVHRQAEVFAEAMPSVVIPSNPAMRLASERLRLERITGSGPRSDFEGLEPTDPMAPLTQLSHFVEGLSETVRINVVEAVIDDRQFSLRGQTRDHRSAERITETVNQHTAWQARPPRTSRLADGGVEFSLRAMRKSTDLRSATVMK